MQVKRDLIAKNEDGGEALGPPAVLRKENIMLQHGTLLPKILVVLAIRITIDVVRR